jgi:NADH-quinone oxidoreductase subunit F
MIIMDETVDIAWLAYKTTKFFTHESCGKCTPCREGTYWMYHLLNRIVHGKANLEDIDLLDNVAQGIEGKCLCALGEFSIMPVVTGIKHFRSDYEAHIGDAR